jgi:L-fucose mutarotase/ribose pyranase (RbsD/FucU family)
MTNDSDSKTSDGAMKALPNWEQILTERLPLFGHRNWIVVADAAYPSQSRPGVETIASGETQQAVVETVLARLRECSHVRPVIHLDRELAFVDERDALGVDAYRRWLDTQLKGQTVDSSPHDEIIAKMDQAAQMFSVLVVKTAMTIPYTTVFIELDCGYWNGDSELRLRRAMQTA